MKTKEYKGFTGIFNLVEEAYYHGKIDNISDLVTFEGVTIEEINSAFIEAVEDYLELCKEVGK